MNKKSGRWQDEPPRGFGIWVYSVALDRVFFQEKDAHHFQGGGNKFWSIPLAVPPKPPRPPRRGR